MLPPPTRTAGSSRSGPGVRPYASAGLGLIRQRVEAFGDLLEEYGSLITQPAVYH